MNMMMKMMTFFGGMGIMGYLYFKKHPEKVNMMKQMGKEMSRKMYNYLDNEK